ncbi:MAG: GNAT family N-acetyltransferase [Bacillota bacterium]|nr:GNAT family N-acetyltransferase [Bacillota bacterium]
MHKKVDYQRLIQLFNEAGWTDKTSDLNRLKQMAENSQIVVTAWDDEYMVGFARCTTDHVFNGQINNVVVDSKYRNQGIGKCLVKKLLESDKGVTYILRGDPENEEFYKQLGFEPAERAFLFKRIE